MPVPRPALPLLLVLPLAAAGCGGDKQGRGDSASAIPTSQLDRAAGVPAVTGGALVEGAARGGLPSVVAISVTSGGTTRNGTGTLLSEGTVVTDASLVTTASGAPAAGVTVREGSGEEHAGVVDGVDRLSGLAALRVTGLDALPPAKAASGLPALGTQAVALGYLAARRAAVRAGAVVTTGRAARLDGDAEVGLFETTAPLGGQAFGGPVVDGRGRVLGIMTRAIAPAVPGSVVALPVAAAERIGKALEADGRVRRAWLGVDTVGISPTRAEELRLTTSSGVILRSTAPGSPASYSTLREPSGTIDIGGRAIPTGGDVIVQIDRTRVREPEDLDAAVAALRPGDKVTLTVIRGDQSVEVHLTLGEH